MGRPIRHRREPRPPDRSGLRGALTAPIEHRRTDTLDDADWWGRARRDMRHGVDAMDVTVQGQRPTAGDASAQYEGLMTYAILVWRSRGFIAVLLATALLATFGLTKLMPKYYEST